MSDAAMLNDSTVVVAYERGHTQISCISLEEVTIVISIASGFP